MGFSFNSVFLFGVLLIGIGCGRLNPDNNADQANLPTEVDFHGGGPETLEENQVSLAHLSKLSLELEIVELVLTESGAMVGAGQIVPQLSWKMSETWEAFCDANNSEAHWLLLDGKAYFPREAKTSRPVGISSEQVLKGALEFRLKIEDFAYEDEVLIDQKIRITLDKDLIENLVKDGEWITQKTDFTTNQYLNKTGGHIIFRISKTPNPN